MSSKGLKNANLGVFDLFGTTPTFKIQGHKKHYSICGLLLTVMVLAFVIWALVLTSRDLMEKKNPILVASELPGAAFNETFILTPDNFQVKVALYDSQYGTVFTNKSIYTVQARLYNTNAQTPAEMAIDLDLEVCQSNMIQEEYLYWCLKANQSKVKDLSLNSKTFIQINFLRCRNNTGNDCATLDEIDAKLKKSIAQIEYLNWATDPTDYNHPLKSFYVSEQQGVLVSLYKIINIYMKKIDFISDNGWLTEDPLTQTAIYPEKNVVDSQEVGSKTSSFFSYIFYPSGNKVLYTRKYSKIQDILAQVSGLAGVFILIVGLLVKPYDEFKMSEKVINTMYDIRVKISGKNSPFKSQADGFKTQGTFNFGMSEEYIGRGQSNYHPTLNTARDEGLPTERHALNKCVTLDIPSDTNRFKRILDASTPEKINREKPLRSIFNFPRNTKLTDQGSQKDHIEEEEPENLDENQELELVEIGNQATDAVTESREANPSPALTRFDSQAPSEQLNCPLRMNSRNDTRLHMPKVSDLPEDSVQKENTEDDNDMKEIEIEEIMQTMDNHSPNTDNNFQQNTIQIQSPSNIETDGNLLRQLTFANENYQARKTQEGPSQRLNIGYWEWLYSFVRPTQKMKIFQRGMEELMKQMDIITLVRKLGELDKMKACLLTKEQKVLFDNLKKPKLFVYFDETKNKSEAIEINNWLEAHEAEEVKPIEAYQTLKRLNSQSGIDRKLTTLFEKEEFVEVVPDTS